MRITGSCERLSEAEAARHKPQRTVESPSNREMLSEPAAAMDCRGANKFCKKLVLANAQRAGRECWQNCSDVGQSSVDLLSLPFSLSHGRVTQASTEIKQEREITKSVSNSVRSYTDAAAVK
jgi:hypothetical protein